MLTVWVPVDGGADALVVSCNLLLGPLVMAEIPSLYGSVVRAESELYGIGRRPLDVTDTAIHASVVIPTAADSNIPTHVAQVPQTDRVVMASRQQQMALVGVEGQFVYLTRMLVQPGELDACAVQVVQYDFAICSGSGDVGAELAMGPLYVVYAQALALSGMRIGIIEDCSPQVGLVDDLGILDADSLQDLLASEDGMGAFTVDVEGRDVEACLMACILGVARADADGCECVQWLRVSAGAGAGGSEWLRVSAETGKARWGYVKIHGRR